MTTALLILLGIVVYILIGMLTHITLLKLSVNWHTDEEDLFAYCFVTSLFWIVMIPLSIFLYCFFTSLDKTYKWLVSLTEKVLNVSRSE